MQRRGSLIDRDLALVKLAHARTYLSELHAIDRDMDPLLSDTHWNGLIRIFMSARNNFAGNNMIMAEHLKISPTAIGRFPQRKYKPYQHQAQPIVRGLIKLFNAYVSEVEGHKDPILPAGWTEMPSAGRATLKLKAALQELHTSIRGSNSLVQDGVLTESQRSLLLSKIQTVINLIDGELMELGLLISLGNTLRDLGANPLVAGSSAGGAVASTEQILETFIAETLA